jgi:hypothetical protein
MFGCTSFVRAPDDENSGERRHKTPLLRQLPISPSPASNAVASINLLVFVPQRQVKLPQMETRAEPASAQIQGQGVVTNAPHSASGS